MRGRADSGGPGVDEERKGWMTIISIAFPSPVNSQCTPFTPTRPVQFNNSVRGMNDHCPFKFDFHSQYLPQINFSFS